MGCRGVVFLFWKMYLACVLLLMTHVVDADVECHDAYSCQGGSSSTTSGVVDVNIECFGYYSCGQFNAFESDEDVYCDGSHSCYQALGIEVQDSGYVYCRGQSSCQMANIESYSNVFCQGERSCYGSTIIGRQNFDLDCDGLESCSSSLVHLEEITSWTSEVNADGYLALSSSLINVTATGSLSYFYLYLTGTSSGQNSRVVIANGVRAYVYCSGTDSCNGLTVECSDGSTDCDYSLSYSSSWTRASEFTGFPDLSTLMQDKYEQSLTTCVTNSADVECYDWTQTTVCDSDINVNHSICCSAHSACSTHELRTGTAGASIRCDGYQSCVDTNVITAVRGSDLYFSGSEAAATTSDITNTKNYDLLCTAYRSCRYSSLTSARSLYCMAGLSCEQTTISQMINVYIYGEYGASSTSITNIDGNIYANSRYALNRANVANVNGSIYVNGFSGLQYANVTHVHAIFVRGQYALSNARVRGFTLLNITGNSNLDDALIITESPNGTAILNINNDEGSIWSADEFTVFCSDSDVCQINCLSSSACYKMQLYCYGDCQVRCYYDEYGYQYQSCPTVLHGDVSFVCHNALDCTGLQLRYSSETFSSQLECYGYSSCLNADDIDIDSVSNCAASRACYGSTSLSASSAVCDGLQSCSNVEYLTAETVVCNGELACSQSELFATNLECGGERSCSESQITINLDKDASAVIEGNLGAFNSIFYVHTFSYDDLSLANYFDSAEDYTTVDFFFHGAASGYNSTIVCGAFRICFVTCTASNACKDLTWYCDSVGSDDVSSCRVEFFCSQLEKETHDVQWASISGQLLSWDDYVNAFDGLYESSGSNSGEWCASLNDDFFLLASHTDLSGRNDSVDTCSIATKICDNYQECNNEHKINSTGHVCCSGAYSCNNVEKMYIADNKVLRCDAKTSCNNIASLITDDYTWDVENDNVSTFFTGTSATYQISINSLSNISCTAHSSCYDSSISRAQNFYCRGYGSCMYSSIYETENVYSLGYQACQGCSFSGTVGNVYCGATLSCANARFSSRSYAVDGFVYGNGDQCLSNAYLSWVYQVTANGPKALYQAQIESARFINASGSRVMELAQVEFSSSQLTELYLDMTDSVNPMYVICSGYACDIHCLSASSCQYMLLNCSVYDYGYCHVYCDDLNGISCPIPDAGTSYVKMADEVGVVTAAPTGVHMSDEASTSNGASSDWDDWAGGIIAWLVILSIMFLLLLGVLVFFKVRDRGDIHTAISLMEKQSTVNVMSQSPSMGPAQPSDIVMGDEVVKAKSTSDVAGNGHGSNSE